MRKRWRTLIDALPTHSAEVSAQCSSFSALQLARMRACVAHSGAVLTDMATSCCGQEPVTCHQEFFLVVFKLLSLLIGPEPAHFLVFRLIHLPSTDAREHVERHLPCSELTIRHRTTNGASFQKFFVNLLEMTLVRHLNVASHVIQKGHQPHALTAHTKSRLRIDFRRRLKPSSSFTASLFPCIVLK